ncbi:uncharacterized protein C8Q71DRAFT_757793 [Rhodofomes roseus]|uniref:Homeobox domain-containing protein n=1 Tax=Rhodofomes roseus TaxID=34475 RepID=A0ABQ8KIM2_9APHY|nr:uncharacterized protein C8Q71DRAFT_757793 [Rhodofomes roseus]KAH9837341.1 hypothetical protein C8Q71DRAFT_757793 [Rhodofomes roseus]
MLPPPPAWARDDLPSPTTPEQHRQQRPAEPKSRKQNPAAQDTMDQPKKPRHRHSAFQLAALNELYDKNEHPSLEERTSLAERLGMETKTVNSWFQNKRASCKKRHKGAPATTSGPTAGAGSSATTGASAKKSSNSNSVELPPISALIASVSTRPGLGLGPPPPRQSEYSDYDDDEYMHRLPPTQQQLFYAGNPHHDHLDAPEQSSRPKARSRPSAVQTEELRKVYDVNPHPAKEEREELGHKIGMRYQSVTNWFQNQRSIAKKRKDEEDAHAAAVAAHAASSSKPRMFSPFPPAASAAHPSLSLSVPPATGHPSLALPLPPQHSISAPPPRARRSSSAAPLSRGHDLSHGSSRSYSRPSSPRVSPYRMPSDRLHGQSGLQEKSQRPRRTRPEPHQLEALKKVFRRTSTPSIEERSALALAIGMDVGKVTNWFRNLRQTARKRAAGLQQDGLLEEGEIDQDEQDELMDVDADDVSLATYQSRSATPMHSTGVSSSVSSPLMHALHPSQPPPPYSLEDVREEFAAPRYEARYTPPSPVQPPSEENLRQLYTYARAMRRRPASANEHSSSSDPDTYADGDSHMGSEEDMQEALTPSPESSPPPPPLEVGVRVRVQKAGELKRAQVKVETGVKVEDALLLLSFHHHVVH